MSKIPSQRQLRVGELVRHALSDILLRGDIRDPDIAGRVITIPEVRMSPDLKAATAYVAPLGDDDADIAVAALNRNSRWLRGQVARRLTLKFSPSLRFSRDDRFEEASKIDALLRSPDVARDLDHTDEPAEDGADAPSGGDTH